MKRLIILSLTLILLVSCSISDNGSSYDGYSLDVLPIESVDMPDTFTLGETYPITVHYFTPSTCYSFKEFYYLKNNNERTVAVINYVADNPNCTDLQDELTEATFNFVVTSNGSYVFKFWQGTDENGDDQYLTIEVPVTN
ncbi:hypothetical protein GCM10007962_26690 [Yeosuana aromativorans]|jgi:hypothetical protein|uniref:GOLD domain-containing protein n=1 Tax=Yeosuana aromativorans TaxID=288019 RepID=A0A8J3FI28_9FLAO|nr:hypothetical protein [Yeosuana aromativorans]GGK31000.1 hypothetical protein GCM10007962_26690 [Yeosuana aromativorans]